MNKSRSRGRPRGTSTTKDDILAAARRRFLEHGYDGVTLRAVATDAGVDVALISYYFGSKKGLFGAAMALGANPALLLAGELQGPLNSLPERLVRHGAARLGRPGHRPVPARLPGRHRPRPARGPDLRRDDGAGDGAGHRGPVRRRRRGHPPRIAGDQPAGRDDPQPLRPPGGAAGLPLALGDRPADGTRDARRPRRARSTGWGGFETGARAPSSTTGQRGRFLNHRVPLVEEVALRPSRNHAVPERWSRDRR